MNTEAEVNHWRYMSEARIAKLRGEAVRILALAEQLESEGISPLQTRWKGQAADRYFLKGLELATALRYQAGRIREAADGLGREIQRISEEEIRQIRIREEMERLERLRREGYWMGSTGY